MRTRKIPPPEKRCQKSAGTEEQCRAPRRKDSEYCFFHSVNAEQHREELFRLADIPLKRSDEIHEFLVKAVRAVMAKRLDPQRAYAVVTLVRQLRENLPGLEAQIHRHQQGAFSGWPMSLIEEVAWSEAEKDAQESKEEGGAETPATAEEE